MFTVKMMPAKRGDCLWIEYGDPADPHRILIDGGLHGTGELVRSRLMELDEDKRSFELVIVTHIDLDHIGGILNLLRDAPPGLRIDEIWFNGWDQLVEARDMSHREVLGPRQGEAVSFYIEARKIPHNVKFSGPVCRTGKDIPSFDFGGMKIQLLGPTADRLAALLPVWKEKIEKLRLTPGDAGEAIEQPDEKPDVLGVLGDNRIDSFLASNYRADDSEANGSSIAVLLEYEGKQLLCLGDAFAEDIAESADLMAAKHGTRKLRVDAVKVSHHGGRKNTSEDLIRALHCSHWLVSTDGSTYSHPHGESLARIIRYAGSRERCTLYFNYDVETTEDWNDDSLQQSEDFVTVYPAKGEEGLLLDLEAI